MSTVEQVVAESAGVKILFTWEKDRFHYAFEMADNPTGKRLEAVAGEAIETPVFMELHQQDELLFLSGMSDDRHWSMSVEPTGKGFALDMACRAKLPIAQMGAVYQGTSPESFCLTGESPDGAAAPLVVPAEKKIEVIAQGDFESLPATVRCRYRVERA